ncbi:hypothetical protein FQN55_009111 [Onygenales sp. PD_40]|nr:hypothetical protein FQN55_009111 [Onygenales sp. PD_40]KAK2785716.1 hypothetical protein FQN52_008265 [Onygenales sp. PD_12]KAK2788033.1 hypothetical protein FQN53_004230 [Emmonsiellopsis sp. PD_33]
MFAIGKRSPGHPYRIAQKCGNACRLMTSQAKPKQEGDISAVFSSLSGGESKPLPERFAQVKKQLIKGHEDEVLASWKRLLKALADENRFIAENGSNVIPEIQFADIKSRPKEFEKELKRRGVAVIKGVVPCGEAREYKNMIESYVKANPFTRAFPQDKPAVFELYWSTAQVKARGHPNLIEAEKYLMSLWDLKDPNSMISTTSPLAYADRVRIRQPGDSGFALGPHSDGGSVERWEPNGYGLGHVYDKIFSGNWEQYNPWEVSCRLPIVSDLYNSAGGCSMFRMFQGWLSMSETRPGEGTLMVNPLLQLSTAYYLLRPFFTPLRQPDASSTGKYDSKYLHEDNWVLEPDTTTALQGAGEGLCQEMNTILHPHLDLANTMVHVPHHQPGDFIVWHCDSIHAVDKVHAGNSDSSVLYIPVCPLTETNLNYLTRQRETFLSGLPGPDFPGGKGESEHEGRASVDFLHNNLSTAGLRAMGFAKFENSPSTLGERKMIEKANAVLGF